MASAESVQAESPLLSYHGDQAAALDRILRTGPLLLGMSHLWGNCSATYGFGAGLPYIWRRNSILVTGDGLCFADLLGSLGCVLPSWAGLTPLQTSFSGPALLVSLLPQSNTLCWGPTRWWETCLHHPLRSSQSSARAVELQSYACQECVCPTCPSFRPFEVEPRVHFSLMPLPTTEQLHRVDAQEMKEGLWL